MKKLRVYFIIDFVLLCVFTLLSLSFRGDISLLAFPISALFTAGFFFFVWRQVFKLNSCKQIENIRRYFWYEPLVSILCFMIQRSGKRGFPFAYDLVATIVWVLIVVMSILLLVTLSDKNITKLKNEEWNKYLKNKPKKPRIGTLSGKELAKFIGKEALDWVDAFVQIMIILYIVNIFFFQLYAIPSESMVPTLLKKDRVFVGKTTAGPKMPLSEVGLPDIQRYKRGDVVVLKNPHYTENRKSQIRSAYSNLVESMTLTMVHINKDENGNQKADPLVKRIVGIQGEQLMMMDGVLYARTSESDEFHVVKEDEDYACWNLNKLNGKTRRKVDDFVLSQTEYELTLQVEQMRNELDLVKSAKECYEISKEFSYYCSGKNIALVAAKELYSERDLNPIQLYYDSLSKTQMLMHTDGGSQFFNAFMTDWIKEVPNLSSYMVSDSLTGENYIGGDLYTDSLFRLNVMEKIAYGRLMLKTAKYLSVNPSAQGMEENEDIMQAKQLFMAVSNYILHLDQRNFGLFPANDEYGNPQYIPEDNYFMMGDNRYNSLDMRHRYTDKVTKLFEKDDLSIVYNSYLEPKYLDRTYLLGKASYIWWPMDRCGKPGNINRYK